MTLESRPRGGGLSRTQRIRRHSEFQAIQSQGSRVQSPHFVFVLAKRESGNDADDGPRLGVVVSRRIGNAVVRNRVKRLMREAFRATRGQFGHLADVVVIARSRQQDWGVADVISEWRAASNRIIKLAERLGLARLA